MVTPVEHALYCEGCGVEMTWAPILSEGRRYCCAVCARGGECGCGYSVEDEEEEGPAVIES
jgi:hypothetical protein